MQQADHTSKQTESEGEREREDRRDGLKESDCAMVMPVMVKHDSAARDCDHQGRS